MEDNLLPKSEGSDEDLEECSKKKTSTNSPDDCGCMESTGTQSPEDCVKEDRETKVPQGRRRKRYFREAETVNSTEDCPDNKTSKADLEYMHAAEVSRVRSVSVSNEPKMEVK